MAAAKQWMGYDYKIPLIIKVWDGGLNTKQQPSDLPSNQSPSLLNIWSDSYGAIKTTPGFVTFASGLGLAPIDGITSYAPTIGSPYLVAACNGSIFYSTAQSAITGATFASVPSAQSLFTSGNDVRFLTTDGKMLVLNGNVVAHKWDGTYFTQFGIPAPPFVPAVGTGAAGLLTGTYTYWVSQVNSALVESALSQPTYPTVFSGSQATVFAINTAPASYGVNYYNLYRNTAAGAGIPWLVTAITNGTTSYTDNIPDSALVNTIPQTIDASGNLTALGLGQMPNCKYVVDVNGYLFASGNSTYPQRIWWSQQGARENFPPLQFLDVGKGDGYPITGLSVFGTTIAIHKNDGYGNGRIWLLYMPDTTGVSSSTNWSLMGSPCYYAAQSDKTIVFARSIAYYLSRTGMFAFSGQDLAQSAADSTTGKFSVDAQSFDIEPTILALNNAAMPKAAAINFNNKIFVAVPSGNVQTTNNKILIFDFMIASQPDHVKGAWFMMDNPAVNCFASHAGVLVAGSAANNGQVYQLLTGTNGNGSIINATYTTPEIVGDEKYRDYTKVWRTLDVTYENSPATLFINYINDAKKEAGLQDSINMAGTYSFWGAGTWSNTGSYTWNAGANRSTTRIILQGAISRKIQFVFSTNALDAAFTIHEIVLRYTIKGAR